MYKGSCQGGAAARIDSNRQLHCCRASDPTCVPPCLLFTRPWQVWELASGALVQGVPQKQVSREHWPALHWAGDESAFAHCVTNTVHVYSKADNFASKCRAAACSGSGFSAGADGALAGAIAMQVAGSHADIKAAAKPLCRSWYWFISGSASAVG